MRPKTIFAGILVVLGIVVLAYSGITYKTRGKPADIGPGPWRPLGCDRSFGRLKRVQET